MLGLLHRVWAVALALALIGCLNTGAWWLQSRYAPINYSTSAEKQRGADSTTNQESPEAAIARYNWWLMIFTGILAVATIGLGSATVGLYLIGEKQIEIANKSTEVAEKAFIAANRPWVKIDIQVGGPIAYNVNGANFTLRYIMKNIGHSPATNVWPNPKVIAPILDPDAPENFSPRAELQNLISEMKKRPPSPFGYALFPDDVIAQDITVIMSQDEIKRATKLLNAIYPTIVGVVDYRMGFDEKSHQTGFIVEIRRSDIPRPSTIENNRWPAAIWVDEGDVPAADVRLHRSLIEGGYAD
jgi:hypothetical protein